MQLVTTFYENKHFYYPPRDVFALNTGKYRPGCIFFCIHRRPGTMDNECK